LLLELYDRNHKKLANLTGIKSPHIQRTLEYGDETLDFSYPTSGPWLAQLLAECYIRTDRQEYVVKAVEKSSTSAWRKVSCALNIEELEGAPFEGFETVEQTVQAAAEFALEGTGWTVEADADITKKRTIRKEDDTTVWEVVKQIVTTYRLELEIDAVNKRLKFHTRRGRDRGAYFIERLNLRSLGVKTSSYGFYTRLIPIGKDGLHLWRDGQNYIENHQYSDKVITSIWRDERYTVTAALLEDAQARLDEASTPARAYTAELVDLAAQSDKYNALAYDLGDAVLLVSEKTDEREKQRIVKLDEYPDDPLANKAELSNVKQTFAQLQKTEAEMATADAVAIATKRTKKVLKDDYLTKKETEVKISALAESIELEVSKTYMTVANGQAAIDKALEAGKQYTDGKLTEYSTTDEMKSAINQTATQISLEVSAQLSGRNLLRYQKFEDKKAGDWHTTVTGDVLTASFFASETAKFYVKEEADAALCELARGRCLTVSGYYKVVKPFQSAAIRLSASWTYTSGTSQSLHYVQNAVFKTDEVSADWIYYEKSYTSELLDEPIKYLGMLCEITPSKAGTDGQIQWKDWTLKISTPVQNGTVRSKFAMDASSATIDTGRLTFNSNTIVINSTNFKLDAYGNVTAKGAFESGDEQSGGYACIKNGTLELKYNGDTNLYFTTTVSGSSYANMHLCGPGGQDAIILQARQNEGSGIFLFDKDANQKAYIMGNGAAKFGGGVGIGGDLTLPEDYNHVLYMRRSKLQPCNGKNSLYCDWVNVRGTDGNSYWVLAGFGSYRGS
jgi:phage minor structural protein